MSGGRKNVPPHRVAVSHKEMIYLVGARACGEQNKAVLEERMSGSDDLDFGQVLCR